MHRRIGPDLVRRERRRVAQERQRGELVRQDAGAARGGGGPEAREDGGGLRACVCVYLVGQEGRFEGAGNGLAGWLTESTDLLSGRLPLVASEGAEPLALEDAPRALPERLHQGREPLCVHGRDHDISAPSIPPTKTSTLHKN